MIFLWLFQSFVVQEFHSRADVVFGLVVLDHSSICQIASVSVAFGKILLRSLDLPFDLGLLRGEERSESRHVRRLRAAWRELPSPFSGSCSRPWPSSILPSRKSPPSRRGFGLLLFRGPSVPFGVTTQALVPCRKQASFLDVERDVLDHGFVSRQLRFAALMLSFAVLE